MSPDRPSIWLLSAPIGICEVSHDDPIPPFPDDQDQPVAIVSDSKGHTIVCPLTYLPSQTPAERDWRALQVDGSTTEQCRDLLDDLRELDADVRCLFTLHAKYLLVRERTVSAAIARLRASGIPVFEDLVISL